MGFGESSTGNRISSREEQVAFAMLKMRGPPTRAGRADPLRKQAHTEGQEHPHPQRMGATPHPIPIPLWAFPELSSPVRLFQFLTGDGAGTGPWGRMEAPLWAVR